MMELLHNFLAKPKWEDSAVHRAKQMFLSHYKSLHKSLERETADRIMGAMFGPSRYIRFLAMNATAESIPTLQQCFSLPP